MGTAWVKMMNGTCDCCLNCGKKVGKCENSKPVHLTTVGVGHVVGWDVGSAEGSYTCVCTAVNRDKGVVTYTVGKLEDIVNFEVGPLDRQELQAAYPEPDAYDVISYDELLDEIVAYWGEDSCDRSMLKQAELENDTILADGLRQMQALERHLLVHARAMQAARKTDARCVHGGSIGECLDCSTCTSKAFMGVDRAARKPQVLRRTGPGVYEQAQQRPGVMIKADPPVLSDEDFKVIGALITRDIGAMAASLTPAERTCSTCSKTCDVGAKCWWCGN